MVSKSVWNLPGGPWERIFAGNWNNFNVAVYENAEKTLLTTIFPKSGEVSWIMVRVDKILMVPKDFEKIESMLMSKNMHILKQRIPEKHMNYVILLTPPTKVDFGSKEIGNLVFQKVLELNKEVEEVKNIAKKKGVEILDLKEAPYKESASLLGNPTLLLGLLSIAPEGEEPRKERMSQIVLGDIEGQVFAITEDIFRAFSSVKKGTEDERNYLAQVISEASIMDASPMPLIMNFSKHPLKLDQSNPYPYDYSKYGIESHNVSFSIKKHDMAGESSLKINLNQASPQCLWKIFGLGTDEASTMILSAANRLQQNNAIDNLESISSELSKGSYKKESEKATLSASLRRIRTLQEAYGDIFSKSADFQKEVHEWVQNNDTVFLDLSELDKRSRLAFMLYILDTIERLRISSSSELEQKRLEQIYLVMIGLDWMGDGLLQQEIINKVIESHTGGLFVSEGDLPMKIESRVANKFVITGAQRAKLYQGGRGTEFNVRPLLSCPP
jgi:hypothetical protein